MGMIKEGEGVVVATKKINKMEMKMRYLSYLIHFVRKLDIEKVKGGEKGGEL